MIMPFAFYIYISPPVENNKQEQIKFGIDFPKLVHFTFPMLHVDVEGLEICKNPEPIIIPFAFKFLL